MKHHLTNIFDKLGVANRLELALFAVHHRIESAVQSSSFPPSLGAGWHRKIVAE